MIGGSKNMEALYSQNLIFAELLDKSSNKVDFWNSTFIWSNCMCKTTFSITHRTAVHWQLLTHQITFAYKISLYYKTKMQFNFVTHPTSVFENQFSFWQVILYTDLVRSTGLTDKPMLCYRIPVLTVYL